MDKASVKDKIIFCFIVLHYQSAEETIACIDSIRKIAPAGETKVLVVDNASPNGSGRALLAKYRDDGFVQVLLNGKNEGFSRANNKACRNARKKWDPQYYICCNNDITFPQEDFCQRIAEQYQSSGFSVLGPDIYNVQLEKHQSPGLFQLPEERRVRRTILLNHIARTLLPLSYPFLARWFDKHEGQIQDAWESSCRGVVLNGSCMIFSKKYVDARDGMVFYPETFFYYEECLLTLWCQRNGHEVVYDSGMQVYHNDSMATKQRFTKRMDKMRFQMENIEKSAGIYLKEKANSVRVAVNLLWVRHNRVGGTEVFIRNLLDGFCELDEQFAFVLIVSRDNRMHFQEYAQKDSRISLLCANVKSDFIAGRIIWQNLYLNRLLRMNGLYVCFSPVYDRPVLNGKIHYINVIHDLQAYHYPQYHPLHEVLYSRMVWYKAVHASSVITISKNVAEDIVRHYNISASSLHTIFNPVVISDDVLEPFPEVEKRYQIQRGQYFYTVCQMIPHKNVETLLRVMRRIKELQIDLPKKLLISGISGNATEQILTKIREYELEDNVQLTGFVEDQTRNSLYKCARAFLFPSVFEGFGIPPVEAMMCGATVVTTKCTSIPEVTQGLANYVDDPYDEEEWIRVIQSAVNRDDEMDFSKYDAKKVAAAYLDVIL